jgi:hypothetical protein
MTVHRWPYWSPGQLGDPADAGAMAGRSLVADRPACDQPQHMP